MYLSKKEQEVLDILTGAGTVFNVDKIAKTLFMSAPSVRRHLSSLAEKGLVIRTHGGAIANYNTMQNKNIPLYLRMTSMSEEKNVIAQKAYTLVHDGDVVFLDASSTSFHLIPYLRNLRDITVITNSLKNAITLAELGIKTISLGGEINTSNLYSGGHQTVDMIKAYNADIVFFSCDAISDDGICSDNSCESCFIRKALMNNAKTRVLIIDNTKFHKQKWHNMCSVADVDYLISNEDISGDLISLVGKNRKK